MPEEAQRAQHGIGVHPQYRGHVARRRKPIARTRVAVRDIAPDLCGHLVVEWQTRRPIEIDFQHGDMHSSTMMEVETRPRDTPEVAHPDAVIREARRRQRRRWITIAMALVLGASVLVVSRARRHGHLPPPRTSTHKASRPHSTGEGVRLTGPQPRRPGSLAVGPDGTIYIADTVRDQILGLRAGAFRVVVGNGKVGFGGDGGAAVKAEINNPAGMAVAADGTLYFADSLNGRIRAVSPSGIVSTIAGNGKVGWVADGTPALAAPLNPYALTFGPNGDMYVAADQQVLRLGRDKTFTRVLGNRKYDGPVGFGGPAVDGSADGALGLAFDRQGDLFVFGSSAKDLLMVSPQGTLTRIDTLYPRGYGGLVTAPNGTVIAMTSTSLVRVSPRGVQTLVAFPPYRTAGFHGIRAFQPTGIAIAANGTIYIDTYWGNGFSSGSAIAAIEPNGDSSLLWKQKPPPGTH